MASCCSCCFRGGRLRRLGPGRTTSKAMAPVASKAVPGVVERGRVCTEASRRFHPSSPTHHRVLPIFLRPLGRRLSDACTSWTVTACPTWPGAESGLGVYRSLQILATSAEAWSLAVARFDQRGFVGAIARSALQLLPDFQAQGEAPDTGGCFFRTALKTGLANTAWAMAHLLAEPEASRFDVVPAKHCKFGEGTRSREKAARLNLNWLGFANFCAEHEIGSGEHRQRGWPKCACLFLRTRCFQLVGAEELLCLTARISRRRDWRTLAGPSLPWHCSTLMRCCNVSVIGELVFQFVGPSTLHADSDRHDSPINPPAT